jgi:hypothetical protein
MSLQSDSARQAPRSIITRYIISGLILAVFIVLVEAYFGWSTLLRPWQQLSYKMILAAVVLVFISYWVRAMRLYDYFHDEMHGAFLLCFKLMLQHNLLNNLLPMRSGELSFPLLMARYFNVPMIRSIPVLLGFRMLDLHTLILFALIAAATHWMGIPMTLLLITVWSALPYIAYKYSRQLVAVLDKYPDRKLYILLKKALAGLPQTTRSFYIAWVWTLINWTVKLGVFAWVLTLFIDIPVAAAWTGAITGDLTSVLPIHGLAGAGTYEAGVIAGLIPYNVEASAALQAAINLHVFVLASTIIGGALSLLFGLNKTHG